MAGGGNAAGRGLQSTEAAKMRRHANGAAAVAADAAHRAACGNSCSFAAAGAACGICAVPRVARFSIEEIVRFVGHQKFRRVGVAEENGARGFEARDERSVGARGIIFAKKRTRGTGPARDVDAAFDGEGNAVERPERLLLHYGTFGSAGLRASAVCVQVNK